MGKAKVVALSQIISDKKYALTDLIDLTFYPDRNVAFRAAWLLENVILKDMTEITSHIESILARIKEVEHASCKRHYAKIVMHLTSPGAPLVIREKMAEIELEPVIEQCFDWMIDPHILIAVKVFAAEALFNMRHRYPWIAEELCNQLQYLMRDGTAAIQSKGRRLLGYLAP